MECDIKFTGIVTKGNRVIIPSIVCKAYHITGGEIVNAHIHPADNEAKGVDVITRVHIHDPYITIPKHTVDWMEIAERSIVQVHITRFNNMPDIPDITPQDEASGV